MISAKAIDHINISVKSIQKAKDFYIEYFGMQVIEEYTYQSSQTGEEINFLLIGNPGKLMLCFYEAQELNSEITNSALSHIGINVENFDEALELAMSQKIIDERWGVKDYEKSKSFYITDPNGLGIEISKSFAGGH
ncbi:VOC family protein [Bacteriovorax sp. Seq25_V]|uniref:VOC family protein n=1 Tax=Bacteriovorax sp. Seq25_V TaxID=1201288 RepID=UPI00038A400B|nr:VOC family protein [Bacteriovorax sp. Seq25_V]EQC46048.1 glyoxalase-like domain protein [Bacteriovorax sp. Seq25_V]